MCRDEKKRAKKELKTLRRKNIAFLKGKYGKKDTTPDMYEGITVADQVVPVDFTSMPRCYGKCPVTEDEKCAASLPPKFAVYTDLYLN